MKSIAFGRTSSDAPAASFDRPAESHITKRRSLLLGAGVAGAAAIAARTLPVAPTEVAAAGKAKPTPDESGGYQETQHVLRYYETTRV